MNLVPSLCPNMPKMRMDRNSVHCDAAIEPLTQRQPSSQYCFTHRALLTSCISGSVRSLPTPTSANHYVKSELSGSFIIGTDISNCWGKTQTSICCCYFVDANRLNFLSGARKQCEVCANVLALKPIPFIDIAIVGNHDWWLLGKMTELQRKPEEKLTENSAPAASNHNTGNCYFPSTDHQNKTKSI